MFLRPARSFFDQALGSPQAYIPALTAVWIHYSNVFGKQVNCLEKSSIKDAATTTQEQLDEEAMKSRLWVSVANTIYADSATDTCYATDKDGNKITVLDNREENSRDISYTVTLEDGTAIYQSEIIKPGDGIESPKLSQHLEPGTYSIIATAQGYDAESHNAAGGTVAAQSTLVVK